MNTCVHDSTDDRLQTEITKRRPKWLGCLFLSFLLMTGLALVEPAKAQTESPDPGSSHAVYGELLGTGLLYSLNYEYRFHPDISARVGIMHAGAFDATWTNIPIMAKYLIGDSHNLELGAGVQYMGISFDGEGTEDDTFGIGGSTIAGAAAIGYRYQSNDGGMIFRATMTPLIGDFGTITWGGLSVGYSF
jgi:hypothetical protein